MLYHLSNCSTYTVLRQAYFALAESYIRHGIAAWGNSTHCRILQKTQNRVLKILETNQRLSSTINTCITRTTNNNNLYNFSTNNNDNGNSYNILHHNFQNDIANNSNTDANYTSTVDDNTTRRINPPYNTRSNNTEINNPFIYLNIDTNTNNNTGNNSNSATNNQYINNNGRINNTGYTNNNIDTSTNNARNNTFNNRNNTGHNNATQINRRHNNTNNINNTTNSNKTTDTIAKRLGILNVKNIFNFTIINEFHNDSRFLQVIDHSHNTRRRADGRYKVERYHNNYGKNTLQVTLPTILNNLPEHLMNFPNKVKRKKLLKKYYISSQ